MGGTASSNRKNLPKEKSLKSFSSFVSEAAKASGSFRQIRAGVTPSDKTPVAPPETKKSFKLMAVRPIVEDPNEASKNNSRLKLQECELLGTKSKSTLASNRSRLQPNFRSNFNMTETSTERKINYNSSEGSLLR